MRGRQGKGSKEMRGGIKQQGGSRGGGGLKGKQGHQEKGNWSTRRKESGWENTTPCPSFITDRQT
jgi:hypothetical protein